MLVLLSSTSPSTIAPCTVSCILFRQRSMVDLPQPEGPITAVTEQSAKSIVTFLRTLDLPNHALSLFVERIGASVSKARPDSASRDVTEVIGRGISVSSAGMAP